MCERKFRTSQYQTNMNEVCLLEPELSYSPAVGGQDRVIPVKKVKLETHLTLSLLAPVAADAKICQCAR